MEPPPKQGCEADLPPIANAGGVSVEPPPKQGCERDDWEVIAFENVVSVEPPPKQGCEQDLSINSTRMGKSQWNPRRSRGARYLLNDQYFLHYRLSGTPAEAGVRGFSGLIVGGACLVSVEPPPKQGCEEIIMDDYNKAMSSQWNPRRSRGASAGVTLCMMPLAMSQWNPRRSRGASLLFICSERRHDVSVEPPPKQGCEGIGVYMLFSKRPVSVEPPPKQGCESKAMQTRQDAYGLSGTPAEAGVRVAVFVTRRMTPSGLSGTPAEAGVRVAFLAIGVWFG